MGNDYMEITEMNLSLSLQEVSSLLSLSRRATKRVAKYLSFPTKRPNKQTIIYSFAPTHPFYQSYLLLKGPAKLIYTLQEIADLYQWKHPYSTKWVTTKLNDYDIPIYNRGNKGYCYLSDLIKGIQNANNNINNER